MRGLVPDDIHELHPRSPGFTSRRALLQSAEKVTETLSGGPPQAPRTCSVFSSGGSYGFSQQVEVWLFGSAPAPSPCQSLPLRPSLTVGQRWLASLQTTHTMLCENERNSSLLPGATGVLRWRRRGPKQFFSKTGRKIGLISKKLCLSCPKHSVLI